MSLRVNLRDLELIRHLADTGTITAASQRMHVSQPAVSQRLRDLQHRIDTPLFERRQGRILPTEAGDRLAECAERVLGELARAGRDLEHMSQKSRARVRLATQCYTCYRWLPFVIRDLLSDSPELSLEIVPESTHDPLAGLDEGRVDIAIVGGAPESPDYDVEKLFGDELFAVMNSAHPLAGRKYLEPADFDGQDLVLYTGRRHFVVDKVLDPAGVRPGRVIQIQMTEAIVELVRASEGIAVLAGWAFDDMPHTADLAAVRIGRQGLRRTWYAVQRTAAPTAQFRSFVRSTRKLGRWMARKHWRERAVNGGFAAGPAAVRPTPAAAR